VLYNCLRWLLLSAAPTQLAGIQELTVAMGPVMTDSLVTRRVREQYEFVPQLLLLCKSLRRLHLHFEGQLGFEDTLEHLWQR